MPRGAVDWSTPPSDVSHRHGDDPTPRVGEDHQDEQETACRGRHPEEIRGHMSDVFAKNVRQVFDGGRRRRTMNFATSDWLTLNPSFSNSPWIAQPPAGVRVDVLRVKLPFHWAAARAFTNPAP